MTAKKRGTDSKRAQNHDQKLQKPSVYLKTEREHKDWYNIHEMGKQRGKPRQVPREIKKEGGRRKHSLRKEK